MALQNIGSVHLEARRLAPAIEAFNASLAVNPSWAPAWNGLGAAEIQRGNRPAAIAAWAGGRARPSNFDALFNLATELANAREFPEARRYLEQFVRTAPPAAYGRDIENVRSMLARLPG